MCAVLPTCVVLAVLAMAAAAPGQPHRAAWEAFKTEHARVYASAAEEAARFAVFRDNVDFIAAENAKGLGYTLGVTQFADLSHDEFKAQQLHERPPRPERRECGELDPTAVPASVDWRTKGVVTPVPNQGECGSSWAWGSAGAVEGAWAIKTGHLIPVSVQQLMDCSGPEGDQGCNGGLMDDAFTYIIKNGGIDSAADYPYLGRGEKCNHAKEAHNVVTIDHAYDVKPTEEAMLAAIATAPVAIAVEADQRGFQLYRSGVFNMTCGTQVDHGALAVGYGTDSGTPYWIVKNWWGEAWGEKGYMRIERTGQAGGGECGVYKDASYTSTTGVAPTPPPPPPPPHVAVGDAALPHASA